MLDIIPKRTKEDDVRGVQRNGSHVAMVSSYQKVLYKYHKFVS